MTPDPLEFADGPNLYAYVHNRPLVSIDPDGQFAFLIPIVFSLALDYCVPMATAYLAECAVGGTVAASLLSGFTSGYNDPLSSALDPGTYSMGDADITTFLCNRAGMLVGAALACKPTKVATGGVKAVANVAGREIVNTAITKTEIAITRNVTNGFFKQSGKATLQKTGQIAERYVAKGGTPSLDALSKAGQVMDKGGYTVAGRSLTKHGFGARKQNILFPSATGNRMSINLKAQDVLDDILTNPATIIHRNYRARFGNTIELRAPDSRGIVYDSQGTFLFFKE